MRQIGNTGHDGNMKLGTVVAVLLTITCLKLALSLPVALRSDDNSTNSKSSLTFMRAAGVR